MQKKGERGDNLMTVPYNMWSYSMLADYFSRSFVIFHGLAEKYRNCQKHLANEMGRYIGKIRLIDIV